MMKGKKVKKILYGLFLIMWTLWGIYVVVGYTYVFIKYGNDDADSSIPEQVELLGVQLPETALLYFEHIENENNKPQETLVYYSWTNRCVIRNSFIDEEDVTPKYNNYYISDTDKDQLIQSINNALSSSQDNLLLDKEKNYAIQYINKDITNKFTPLDISKFNFKKLE